MREWHVTPEYINRRWTEELFCLLFICRKRTIRGISPEKTPTKMVSNNDLFKAMGAFPERV